MTTVDWKKLRDDATTILEGDFAIVITDVKVGESQTKKAMLKCVLTVESGPYAGRKVYHNFTISPESQPAMGMFFRALTTLGLGDAFFAQNPSMESIAQALMGKRANVTIEKREWQGQERENIKSWSEPTGTGAPVMSLPTTASGPSSSLSGMTAGTLGGQPTTPPPAAPGDGPDPF